MEAQSGQLCTLLRIQMPALQSTLAGTYSSFGVHILLVGLKKDRHALCSAMVGLTSCTCHIIWVTTERN